ncbi:hypothetical protein ACFLS0_00615 [Candidatus Bipolaricaulota bacterium]
MKRRTALPLIVVVVLSLAGCFFPEPPDVPINVPSADYNVTASDLLEEFQQNSVAATLKYQGKKIAVSGDIEQIGFSIWAPDTAYALLGGASGGPLITGGVWCYFLDASDAASLAVGDFVTLVGEFNESNPLGGVSLINCSLP